MNYTRSEKESASMPSPCGRYTVQLDLDIHYDYEEETDYAEATVEGFTITGYEFDTIEEQPDESNPDMSWVTIDYLETYFDEITIH